MPTAFVTKHPSESLQIVCGIADTCQEHESAMAFVNVQALLAGKCPTGFPTVSADETQVDQCVRSPEVQAELLRILENMLRISTFPAKGLVAKLKKVWQE